MVVFSSIDNMLELRLLMCSLSGSKFADTGSKIADTGSKFADAELHLGSEQVFSFSALDDAIKSVVVNIEKGDFIVALSLEPVRSILWDPCGKFSEPAKNGEEFYKSVSAHVLSFIDGDEPGFDGACDALKRSRALLVMAVGVAALLAFWQANVTGPSVSYPSCPLLDQRRIFNEDECNSWAKKQLMVDGCDLSGLCYLPQYLILAKILLVDSLRASKGSKKKEGELSTNNWWACRALLAHQKILAERSPSLRAALTALESEILLQFCSTTSSSEMKWGASVGGEIVSILTTAVQLECGLVEYAYSHVDNARERFEAAKEACGLHLSVTGVLGFRTAHQVDPKAQMVLVANALGSHAVGKTSPDVSKLHDMDNVNGSSRASMEGDILMAPKLVGSGTHTDTLYSDDDWNEPRVLNTVQQAVILAQCLDIKKSNPDDELRGWQMAPFIEAVDSQQSSHFMVKSCCQLFRIRWECTRSRTRERALLMMEQLVNEIRESACKGWDRMCYAFCVNFPTLPVLLKEYAELMVRIGLIRDALKIFEELELWNNLIDCYCLLGKKAAAMDLIKERLQTQPDDARLWCALGDVTLNEECYIKAWEVSHHRFARAQRSLGKAAYSKGEYSRSVEHWEAALTLNSLHPDGWFALGSAALKARELNKALDSFTRAVQLDPDNGEAWNNLAAIHMTKKRSKEAFTAFREALKFRRSNWQMWENFAHVALDIKNFGQAIEALQMVLELSQGKRVNLDCLNKLMEEVESRSDSTDNCVREAGSIHVEQDMSTNLSACVISTSCSRENGICKENSKEMEQEGACALSENQKGQEMQLHEKEHLLIEREWLMERVGKLLSRVVQNCQDGAVWGLLARWHRVKGDLTMCSEALLKQVRSLQGSDWQHSRDRFENLCHASLQLCGIYVDIASRTKRKTELYSAQMLLRNIIKQGENFSNTDDYVALEKYLQKIQLQIQASQ